MLLELGLWWSEGPSAGGGAVRWGSHERVYPVQRDQVRQMLADAAQVAEQHIAARVPDVRAMRSTEALLTLASADSIPPAVSPVVSAATATPSVPWGDSDGVRHQHHDALWPIQRCAKPSATS